MSRKTRKMKEINNKKKHLKNIGSFTLAKDGCSKHVRARVLSGCKLQWAELKEELFPGQHSTPVTVRISLFSANVRGVRESRGLLLPRHNDEKISAQVHFLFFFLFKCWKQRAAFCREGKVLT